ncbi:discoidin domain-containing protein [Paenibacillus psychroresistens]|uniref:Discoidin domain-containing protein n=1 Tax=Paenibacillus psychroresistens TaxID=1778678 RepID=A0A6B8RF90_9BACL|nr:discoidin domain-containing protein [Paenibacillus psychroresistens]QGQ94384.1 discoidin domain-containing protein [Paenibacillus psychroresistens]
MKLINRKLVYGLIGGLIIMAGLLYLVLKPTGNQEVKFKKANELIQIGNSHYTIAFNSTTGGIEYILDAKTKQNITGENRGGTLWWAFMDNDAPHNSLTDSKFSYNWSKKKDELALHYTGPVNVDVTVNFTANNRIYMQANVKNQTKDILKSFRFPYELKVTANQVVDGMLPMIPGARLASEFFEENISFDDQYPGVMFAAYVALKTKGSSLALYDLNTKPLATVNVGFSGQNDDPGKSGIIHNYKTWIEPEKSWKSPTIVMEIGGEYSDSIKSYRELNQIDKFPAISEKLGKDWPQYAQLPMLKLDISAQKEASWDTLKANVVDKLDYGSMLHLVGFQTGGHDENYPDFIPPDPQWGSPEALKTFIQAAKDKGNRIVPYTNFSWWGVNSSTLNTLPAASPLTEIAVKMVDTTNIKEDYGPHSGYVMNINDPFVTSRIADEHKKLLDAGMDGVFEDQWGIRNAPYVYNKSIPANTDPSNAYFEGVRNYFAASSSQKMYTEDGTDVLAEHTTGFMGTNYLWDKLGYRANTVLFTEYYPLVGMLERDKVMLYQHDLAKETMTDNKDMLRWNVAMGYNLSGDLFNGIDNDWIRLIQIFQKYVLANYGDAIVKDYKQLTPKQTLTDFGPYKVTANWDLDNAYVMSPELSLSPGGFDIASADSLVRAGSYSRYNGVDLDTGEHNLVEIRDEKQIRVFQPVGSDTSLKVKKIKAWTHVQASAFKADGTKIADIPVEENGEDIKFDYISKILEQQVAYVELINSTKLSEIKDVPFHKVKFELNLALKMPALSTSDATMQLPASLATDGDSFTYWESAKDIFPQTLSVNLGKMNKVSKITLKLPPKDDWATRDQEIQVQSSSDGVKYTELIPVKVYSFDPKVLNVVEIPFKPTETQYLQLIITNNTGWPAAQISEFEVR